MGKIIGIDLGTTNSCVAYNVGGEPQVIANKEGFRTTPSVIAINPDNKEVIVGITAKNQMVTNPKQTFYSIKRLIGRRWDDPEVQRDTKLLPFDLRKSDKGGVEIKFGDDWVAPEVISAKVLSKLKADAETYLGETITEAVITVPAYFDDAQRQATKNAGKIAGLDVKRIINEPTAAALAYGLDKKAEKTIVVYDLGGGTFDVSVLEIGDGVFEVKSTNGDTHLGGDDFDQRIIDWLADEFKKEQGIDLRQDTSALQRLKEAAEKAKITLSSTEKTDINLPYITADANGPKHLQKTITRADLEKLVLDLVDKTFDAVGKAMNDAKVQNSDIGDVVMVGGMTRMPLVVKKVKDFFGKDPHQGVNPDEVVAVGAAIQGAVLSGDSNVQDITLLDVTPLTLGLETMGGIRTPLINRNTTIPTEKMQVFSTASDNQTSVEIHVLQGEREMAKDNKTLGKFILDGIAPAPRGVPQVEVSFKLDANGILSVGAKDKATGKQQSITITASTQLDDKEVESLVKEAAENAAKDKDIKENAEAKIDAESLVFQVEKFSDEMKDKIDAKDKEELSTMAKALKEMIATDTFDKEAVKAKTKELSTKLQEKGAAMYQKASEEAQKEAPKADAEDAKPSEPDGGSETEKPADEPAADNPAQGEVV